MTQNRLVQLLELRVALAALALLLPAAAQQAAKPAQAAPSTTIFASNTAVPKRLDLTNRGNWWNPWQRYAPAGVAYPDLRNPAALERGAASGTLYLSLQQVLRMALAADLDIADASYQQLLARPDFWRTEAGGTARGVAGESISTALFSGAIGASGGGGSSNNGTSAGSVGGGGSGVHGGNGGYDPSFNFTFADEHSRTPLANPILFGTAEQILNQTFGAASFGQGFTTGTGYSISFASFRQYQNSNQLFLNPQISSDVSIGVQQQLLNGGSRSVNRAGMVMGQNSLKYADAFYKLQVTNIVAQAATQYWALAAAQRGVEIAQASAMHAQQTLDNTKDLIAQGKSPAADQVTAQSALGASQQALVQAQTDFRKAASKLKSFLAKQWTLNVINTRIVPSDRLPNPTAANLPPVEQLVNRAVSFSPQLAEDRINVNNDDLTVKIRKNALLPTLAVFASYTSSGVSGLGVNCSVNAFPCPPNDLLAPLPGGFGPSLGKIFGYSAPDYGVGFQLSIPVWNRINRADEATAEIQAAQSRVDLQKDQNTVTEQVNEDRIDLEGQAAKLQAARQQAAALQSALQDAQTKYTLGKGTVTDVITAQVALLGAQQSEVGAQQAYATAAIALAKDSGTLLDEYHISLGKPLSPQSVGRLH
ncbi:MAG TPA: TolC family protein [Terriglobales bacterium]|nr:TolC family protein [Terriglobales bacterium]